MTSPTDPDPTIRRRRLVPATRVLAGGPGAALVLALSTLTAVAAPRGLPQLPVSVVQPVADRSSDPLANAPLRGRVSASQSMLPAGEAPLRGRTAGAEPAPVRQAPAAAPVAAEPAPAGAYGLRQRTSLPDSGPGPVRSVMPYNPSGAAAPSALQPSSPPLATAATPAPVSGVSAIRGTSAGRDRAPISPGEAAPAPDVPLATASAVAAEPVVEQVDITVGPGDAAPVASAAPATAVAPDSGKPVWAIRQPDGSLLLNWTVPGRQLSDPFLVSIVGPDEHTSLRTVRTNGAGWTYSPEAQLIDFGLPITDRLCVRVRSASDGAGALNIAPICIQVSPAS